MELEYRVQEDKKFHMWVLRVGIFSKETWVFVVTIDRPRKTWLPDNDKVYVEPETRYVTRRTRKLYDK